MSDLICITNRKLCSNNFSDQIEMIASAHPKAIVLREKDLSEKEYEQLARQVMQICQKHGTQCILHSFSNVASALGAVAVHMPITSKNDTARKITFSNNWSFLSFFRRSKGSTGFRMYLYYRRTHFPH